MRIAILGDIHGNLEAFQAVLSDLERGGDFDEILCLGDIVGYGPDPHKCIELLRKYRHLCVAGNHDMAAIGKLDISEFNPHAAAAVVWSSRQLDDADIDYIESIPLSLSQDSFTVVHGSPRDPIWEYLLATRAACENLDYFSTDHCLLGHSHIPIVFRCSQSQGADCIAEPFNPGAPVDLSKGRLIINPGAVGQPRDADPRAGYALFDSNAGAISQFRVEYDIQSTQAKMERVGLPSPLITRLSYGR
ncbi:metallophosphoesterase family protein [Chloroflexota bacterium]